MFRIGWHSVANLTSENARYSTFVSVDDTRVCPCFALQYARYAPASDSIFAERYKISANSPTGWSYRKVVLNIAMLKYPF